MNVEYGKPNTAGKVINVIIYIFLILLAAVYLLPLLWVVMTSVKDDKILMISPWAFPEHLMWENYTFAWTKGHLGGATLNSPMPGTVLDIKVAEGAAVTAGQVVLILEAMKMENEITAPADGTVASIPVAKGASVNSGDTLMTFN